LNILLTGGAGYIGSHAAVVFSQAGHEVLILDNFCNSDRGVLARLAKILGKPVTLIEGDVRDAGLLRQLFQTHQIDAVVHFAGLKAVGESVTNPLKYFDNNVSPIPRSLSCRARARKTLGYSSSSSFRISHPKILHNLPWCAP